MKKRKCLNDFACFEFEKVCVYLWQNSGEIVTRNWFYMCFASHLLAYMFFIRLKKKPIRRVWKRKIYTHLFEHSIKQIKAWLNRQWWPYFFSSAISGTFFLIITYEYIKICFLLELYLCLIWMAKEKYKDANICQSLVGSQRIDDHSF